MYVKVKQIEIMMKVSWCIPTVNIKHFIDHFIKILPASDENEKCAGTEYSRFGSPSNKSEFSTVNVQIKSNLANQLPSQLLKEVNKEIEEWVNSIGNLSPLLDDFSCWNLSEMGIAIVWVTISFSFKWLAGRSYLLDFSIIINHVTP